MMQYRTKDFYIFRASSLLSELKAFSVSIINVALQANFNVLREKLFFFTMTCHLQGVTLYRKAFPSISRLSSIARSLLRSPAALPSSAHHFWVTFGFCRSSIGGVIPIPYIAIARGSPCVVPSVNVKTVLLT